MARGKGVKSKIKGRISGYETADFIIVRNTPQNAAEHMNSEKRAFICKEKKKTSILKKIRNGFIYIVVIPFILLLIIGKIATMSGYSYEEPKVITPESSDIKPMAFTQIELDAEYSRDDMISELLNEEWTMTDNEKASNYYITVGKNWDAINSNQSSILKVTTSHEYDPEDQKYQTSTLKIELQELKATGGIIVDSTVTDILKIYNPSINGDSVKSSVQAAYNSISNSQTYEGSLAFDKSRVYINGSKIGRLVNVTIDVNTSISDY
ncbi:hypothetical protein [Clostridium vincentii]|uniref:Uncharacterized protein n=1 Tax=Clostridium vincentii TaxID=52704 RepID=A0A2T0BFF1_9CLOT|nr:hypothetical protein [Clostridium vincentii]PRR82620.1 hypothetical protein CLVI_15870 [Clostridium vincentii]